MGLIRTALNSIKGTLQDQHQTVINCEDMGNDILMMKKTKQNGIIRNGSMIVVNPAQLAVLVDNGRVIDAAAEQGVYEFNSDASPSFFAGNFGGMFREMWTRFAFGGGTWQDQAVYFINIKEIIDNGFGTSAPVMYRDWEHCMDDGRHQKIGGVPLRVGIKCAGNYTFMIDQPWQFMKRIGGTAPIYAKEELTGQMRIEIVSTFQAVLNSLCDEQHQIYPLDLPAQSFYIKELMDAKVFDAPIRERGLRIAGFNIINVSLDDESKAKIDAFEASGDAKTQQARMVDAAQLAAANEAGAGVGFFNIGMMNQAVGTGMFNGPQQMGAGILPATAAAPPPSAPPAPTAAPPPSVPPAAALAGLNCLSCGAPVSGKFCANCGAAAPVPANRYCANCGAKVNGKFCSACGTPV